MPNPSTSRGYNSSSRNANAPGAYYEVLQGDFGVLGGGTAPALAYNAGQGSLGSGTARAAISWITAEGESQVTAEATVAISAGSGAFTATQPTIPTNNGTIIGWRIYSSNGGAGSALLNTAALSTTQVQQTFQTAQGALQGFPISQTTIQVLIYGTGQAEPAIDQSGMQYALPSIGANTSAYIYFRIPNMASLWKTQKDPGYVRPQGISDSAGLNAGNLDILMPLYPGTSQSVTAGTTSYMVINGYLFIASASGTTASTFIGFSAFSLPKYSTTTDGTVTWVSLGKAVLIRLSISNSTSGALTPVAQEYDFFAS